MNVLKVIGRKGVAAGLSLILCLSLLPMAAFAAEGDTEPVEPAPQSEPGPTDPDANASEPPVMVAEVTVTVTNEDGSTTEETKQFTSIADAIKEINGNGTVTLLAQEGADAENPTEITENVVIDEGQEITLNIPEGVRLQNAMGATVGSNEDPKDQSTILNKGTLTITGGGVIVSQCKYDAGVTLRNAWGATATLNGCTFINDNQTNSEHKRSYYVLQNFGTMDIYEGTKVVKDESEQYTVVINGWNAEETKKYSGLLTPEYETGVATLNIHYAEIEGRGIAIRNTTKGVLTVEDGTFTSKFLGIQNENVATIKGGTFSGSSRTYGIIVNDCSELKDGASGTLVITGGVFNNSRGDSLSELDSDGGCELGSSSDNVAVSGGYYKEQIVDGALLDDETTLVTPVVCIKVESENDEMYQAGFLTLEDENASRYLYTNLGDGTTTALPTLMLTNMGEKKTVNNTSEIEDIKWTSKNESIATVDGNGRISARGDGVVTIVATYTVNGKTVEKEYTITVGTVYVPVRYEPIDFIPGGEEIDDPAVPLASGPVTRAEFIDYLWRHEGEPASAGVCTFTDVPEDHEYFAALCWADENGVAEAYLDAEGHEDGTFEPDELVTVAAVREFLDNFADVFGTNAVAAADLTTLTGEDGEAVLNCDEVLAEFFGEEYAAPEQDEAA